MLVEFIAINLLPNSYLLHLVGQITIHPIKVGYNFFPQKSYRGKSDRKFAN